MQKIEILVVVITQHTLLVNLSSWPFVTTEEAEVARVWSAFEPRPRPVPARPLPRPCFFLFVLSEDGLESMTSRIFAASFADPWCSNYKRMHREKKSESWLYESAKECRRESYYRLTLFSPIRWAHLKISKSKDVVTIWRSRTLQGILLYQEFLTILISKNRK